MPVMWITSNPCGEWHGSPISFLLTGESCVVSGLRLVSGVVRVQTGVGGREDGALGVDVERAAQHRIEQGRHGESDQHGDVGARHGVSSPSSSPGWGRAPRSSEPHCSDRWSSTRACPRRRSSPRPSPRRRPTPPGRKRRLNLSSPPIPALVTEGDPTMPHPSLLAVFAHPDDESLSGGGDPNPTDATRLSGINRHNALSCSALRSRPAPLRHCVAGHGRPANSQHHRFFLREP